MRNTLELIRMSGDAFGKGMKDKDDKEYFMQKNLERIIHFLLMKNNNLGVIIT